MQVKNNFMVATIKGSALFNLQCFIMTILIIYYI